MYRNFVRITGGDHKGLQLKVVSRAQLRPTPERVRESIFSKLGTRIKTEVLDLFAGSGILGFEALSRGALGAVFVDNDRDTCQELHKSAHRFTVHNHKIIHSEALAFLEICQSNFGMVFLDPPYKSQLLDQALELLLKRKLLLADALVYAESSINKKITTIGYTPLQEINYGQIKVTLLRISPWAATAE